MARAYIGNNRVRAIKSGSTNVLAVYAGSQKVWGPILESIAVTVMPTVTEYNVGDALDLTGIQVVATYSNGTTADVTSRATFFPANGATLETAGDAVSISVSLTEDGETVATSFDVVVNDANALVFSSASAFTIRTFNNAKNWDGVLEYKAGSGKWTIWDGTLVNATQSGRLYTISFRGTGNKIISGSNDVRKRWIFDGGGGDIGCEGEIWWLLDYKTPSDAEMGAYAFADLFFGMTQLRNAPALPATQLARGCYMSTFASTRITIAPELPAETLAAECYQGMFSNCTQLVSVPSLPATNLADYCYFSMFLNCYSITEAPALPATMLSWYCYGRMFSGCYRITVAPELPATSLAYGCYSEMFTGCQGLIVASALPATMLAGYCYSQMFQNCTNLTTAPALPATNLEGNCYFRMFQNCRSLKVAASQDAGYQHAYRIPSSGTGVDSAGALVEMLTNTGGTFTGTPQINTTYYTTEPPVEAAP